MRVLFLSALIFCAISTFYGQDAPITTAVTINEPDTGSLIVPITVTGFNNIGAISLTLDYDYSVLNFVQGSQNPGIPGWFIINDNNLGNGFHRLLMGWFGAGISLPDGSSIMDIEFTYISGTTTLAWYDDGGSCEYADANYDVLNDLPTEDFYINGYVCGAIGAPAYITGDSVVCQASPGVFYSTDTIPNATSYLWTVPSGATIAGGQNTNAITVNYSDTAVSGLVTVAGANPCDTGSSVQLAVSVNTLPVAEAGNDTIIPYGTSTTLHAAFGGPGSYSYYWTPPELLEDPNVQNPQTVTLTTSNYFEVEVTDDSTSCQNTDDVQVSVSGGPLSVNPVAAPDENCNGDTAQLFANAGGGSGDYTYSWTSTPAGNPPWSSEEENPLVSPDTSTLYHVEVDDGFTTANGDTELTVHALPTAAISGGDTLCGDDSTALTVDLTGTADWDIIYSNGNTTWQVTGIDSTPYLLHVSDSGTYVLLEVEDANCTGTSSGSAVVEKYPVPETPTITQDSDELRSNIALGNQWYLDDTAIEGANQQVYTAVTDGRYYDIVTINTCSSDTSNVIDVLILNVQENNPYDFLIVPNPAKDKVRVQFAQRFPGGMEAKVFSMSGRLVYKSYLQPGSNNTSQTIDIGSLRPGLYFLQISNGKASAGRKLVVQ
ncbi:MAG: T9SS type A sorting domain-containing protein [Bacteroidales bacterium]|nr:T9SS type A sorting domain-containing protein [Bacteroidales bacterium]